MSVTRAWHFVGTTLLDGCPVPPDGEWLRHTGAVEICRSGLHAARRPWHALTYALGSVLCLVDVDEIVEEQDDKLVCRARRIVARRDVTALLWAFARAGALGVAHLWDCPPIVRRYLETGDETIRAAARDAAYAAWNVPDEAGRPAWSAWGTRNVTSRASWCAVTAAWPDHVAHCAAYAAREVAGAAAGQQFDARVYTEFGVEGRA